MSLNPIAAWTFSQATRHLPPNPTVVELGNQTLTVDDPTLDRIIRDAEERKLPPGNVAELRAIRALSLKDRGPFTERLFRALGFSSYACIDLTDKYGALLMDLNVVLREHYGFDRKFDLVTNNGTGEHVFNQLAVFTNVHNLAAKGGIMIHILPFLGYVNHGFYNFNPLVFDDLAHANGYETISMSVSDRLGNERKLVAPHCYTSALARQGRKEAITNAVRTILQAVRYRHRVINEFVIAVQRKTSDEAFQVPIQGKYTKVIPVDRRASDKLK